MPRSLVKSAAAGAAAFIAAHAIEAAAHIGGEHPWFIAAAPSALVTIAAMFAAGLLLAATARKTILAIYLDTLFLVAGASVPMAITLFTNPSGPGNLFPIALVFGAVVLGVGAFAGAALGWLLARRAR